MVWDAGGWLRAQAGSKAHHVQDLHAKFALYLACLMPAR
jgi:hypothetical protein